MIIATQIEYDAAKEEMLSIQNDMDVLLRYSQTIPEYLYIRLAELDVACMEY